MRILSRAQGGYAPYGGTHPTCAGPAVPAATGGRAQRVRPPRTPRHGLGAGILAALALLLAALPYVAGFVAAPRGAVFLGALNNLGDTGQYLAALRQGAEGHLLYINHYTSLRVAPVLMYPLYTLTGLLLSPLRLSALAAYQLLHVIAAAALLAALWRLCRVAVPRRPVLAYAIALLGGGLYVPALLISGLARLPFAPVALTAPEFSLFATLLISPHGALGLAAELWALCGYMRWRRDRSMRGLGALAVGGLALGLCYPFGVVVLLAVVAVDMVINGIHIGLASSRRRAEAPRGGRMQFAPTTAHRGVPDQTENGHMRYASRTRRDFLPAVALLPSGGIALYYALLFRHDPLWGASNMLRLPPPSLAVLLAAYGPLLALAIPAAWRRPHPQPRGVGGEGLLLTWAAVNGLLLLAPLPQTERLLNGWSVALALLAALTLQRLNTRGARRWVMALSFSNVLMALLYLSVTLHAGNPAYYAPSSEVAAVSWLAAHTSAHDVVMASAGSGNLIVSAARCRVVVGQNFETFNWTQAQGDVLRYYASATPIAARATILRRNGVTLVLAGPYERALGGFMPGGRGYRLLYRAGTVRIFAIEGL